MIILHAGDVKKALPFRDTIAAMKSAYAAFSDGRAEVPLRAQLNIAPYQGTNLFMPCFVQTEAGDTLSLKVFSIFPNNASKGIPTIHAAVLVFEPQTGKVIALLEGGTLTAIRTGAASGAATDLLSRKDAKKVGIFGAGVQGRTQLEAVCEVRQIKTAWIYDIDPDNALRFAQDVAGKGQIPYDVRVAKNPSEAVRNVDIICTSTTSNEPVYPVEAVKPGTHINGVGSFTLEMIENPPEILRLATLFVDSSEAVLSEAGEIVEAIKKKIILPESLTEIGEVILGRKAGRTSTKQITFFKSVGIAVQDSMAAKLALENAVGLGLGQFITW
jgi:ornithine cyclodeaminase